MNNVFVIIFTIWVIISIISSLLIGMSGNFYPYDKKDFKNLWRNLSKFGKFILTILLAPLILISVIPFFVCVLIFIGAVEWGCIIRKLFSFIKSRMFIKNE